MSELQEALSRIRTLEGLLPMCAWCKRMKVDDEAWVSVERYVASHTNAAVTHGICPSCQADLES